MRVSALYRTLALGILRGLSEFCGKRMPQELEQLRREDRNSRDRRRQGYVGQERTLKAYTMGRSFSEFTAESGLRQAAGRVQAIGGIDRQTFLHSTFAFFRGDSVLLFESAGFCFSELG